VAGSDPGWTTGVREQAEAEVVLGVQCRYEDTPFPWLMHRGMKLTTQVHPVLRILFGHSSEKFEECYLNLRIKGGRLELKPHASKSVNWVLCHCLDPLRRLSCNVFHNISKCEI
jgi:hypothetical protein